MNRKKIGAVSYLNTKPLVMGLDALSDKYEVVFDLPSRLADRLAAGELDVALIPSVEAVLDPTYFVVSDACIGCVGPVRSVKLLSRKPASEIVSVALDVGSRTSRALTKVILKNKFGVIPTVTDLKMTDDWRQSETDAVLIIGDRAMHVDDARFCHQWDLGEVWNQWTGLPFVFALWIARTEDELDELDEVLSLARNRGLANIEQLATENHQQYGLSQPDCLQYLNEHLHFYLGADEKRALEMFFDYAAELDLIPQDSKLKFYDCQRA